MTLGDGVCVALQTSLNRVAGANVGSEDRQIVGFTDSLIATENTGGFERIDVSTDNGGTRLVKINYWTADGEDDIFDDPDDFENICSAGVGKAMKSQILDPDVDLLPLQSIVRSISAEDMGRICSASSDQMRADMVNQLINPAMIKLNKALLTQMLTLFGDFHGGSNAVVNAPLVTAAIPNAPNFAAWDNVVKNNLRKIRVPGRPIVVGAGNLGISSYAELMKIGCCNEGGIDLSRAGNRMAYFYDQDVDAIWGQDHFLAYAPGALQLVRFNQYAGANNPKRITIPNLYESSTITDPETGITWDIEIDYDRCEKVYKMQISLRYMLFALPIDMYKVGDAMNGVRKTLRFKATNA